MQPMDLALKWIQDAPLHDTVDHNFLVNMVLPFLGITSVDISRIYGKLTYYQM